MSANGSEDDLRASMQSLQSISASSTQLTSSHGPFPALHLQGPVPVSSAGTAACAQPVNVESSLKAALATTPYDPENHIESAAEFFDGWSDDGADTGVDGLVDDINCTDPYDSENDIQSATELHRSEKSVCCDDRESQSPVNVERLCEASLEAALATTPYDPENHIESAAEFFEGWSDDGPITGLDGLVDEDKCIAPSDPENRIQSAAEFHQCWSNERAITSVGALERDPRRRTSSCYSSCDSSVTILCPPARESREDMQDLLSQRAQDPAATLILDGASGGGDDEGRYQALAHRHAVLLDEYTQLSAEHLTLRASRVESDSEVMKLRSSLREVGRDLATALGLSPIGEGILQPDRCVSSDQSPYETSANVCRDVAGITQRAVAALRSSADATVRLERAELALEAVLLLQNSEREPEEEEASNGSLWRDGLDETVMQTSCTLKDLGARDAEIAHGQVIKMRCTVANKVDQVEELLVHLQKSDHACAKATTSLLRTQIQLQDSTRVTKRPLGEGSLESCKALRALSQRIGEER